MTMRIALRAAFGFAPLATSVTWTDITQWVDLAAGIRVTRGASDELSQTQPGTMSLTLDNPDGRFSAGLASSPYHPYVRPNCLVQLGVVTVPGKNFMRDPSFESGELGGWFDKATDLVTDFAPDTTRAHSGTYSLLVEWRTTGTGGVMEHTVFGLDVGHVYTVSGWVWVPAGDPPVRWRIDNGAPGTTSSVTGAWQQISLTWTATATSHVVQLTTSVTSPVAGDRVWLDDVQVEAGAAVTAFDSAGAEIHWRFYGLVNDWDTGWTGVESQVSLTATDLFKILSKQPQLSSLLTEEMLLRDPIVYYPLTEPSTSMAGGDIAGDGAGSLVSAQVGTGGTLAFGESEGPSATGQSSAKFTPAAFSDGVRLDAHMGPVVEAATSSDYLTFECWFKTSVQDRYFFYVRSDSFRYQLGFALNASGFLTIEYTTGGGALSVDVVNAVNMADGQWHHVLYDEFDQEVRIDNGTPISVSVPLMYALRYLTVGGGTTRMWDGSVAHVAMYRSAFDAAALATHYDAGTTGFAGEDADDRVMRLGGYAGIAAIDATGTFSPVASQGQGGQSALELMRQVEETEGGKLAMHRDGHALLFQSRTVRYSTPASVSLEYADLETGSVSLPSDDQKQVNTLTATRPGGATQRITSASSIAAFGPYPKTSTILKVTDPEVVDAAYWTVSRYAVPQPELREIPVKAYTMPIATYRALLDADISTVIEVTVLPAEAAASTIAAVVEGYTEQIGQASHLITYHSSRAQTNEVWVLDDPVHSVLGTSTRLAY